MNLDFKWVSIMVHKLKFSFLVLYVFWVSYEYYNQSLILPQECFQLLKKYLPSCLCTVMLGYYTVSVEKLLKFDSQFVKILL